MRHMGISRSQMDTSMEHTHGIPWRGVNTCRVDHREALARARDEVAVATPFGVSWLKDGKPQEYWSWGAATSIAAACVKGEKAGDFALNYDVAFPSGREANLARPEDKIADLVPRLAVLDARLRAGGVPRFTSVEPGCVEQVGRPLTPAERETLREVVGR